MKVKFTAMLPYLALNGIVFYALTNLAKTPGFMMVVFMIVLPIMCFFSSLALGYYKGFSWIYCAAIALIFTPQLVIMFGMKATTYLFVYALVTLLGNGTGELVSGR